MSMEKNARSGSWLAVTRDRFAMLGRTSVWSIRTAFASSWWMMSLTVVLTVLVSLFPSVQALLVQQLTAQVGYGRTGEAVRWAVLTGLFVAGYLGVQQVVNGLTRMIQEVFSIHYSQELNMALAALDPWQITDERVNRQSRQAREAVDEGKVCGQSISLLSLFSALVVCVSLLVVIWSASRLSAILIVLSLFPMTVAMIAFSSHDMRAWQERADAHRHASYREDQLRYERPARELAVYDAGALMAGWANRWRVREGQAQIRAEWIGIRFNAVAGLVSSLLIIGALVSLITSGASASQLAGSLVGILSGIAATNDVGYMVGMLMSSSVAVQSYLDFLALKPRHEPQPAAASEGGRTRRDAGSLQVHDLSVSYASDAPPTVRGVSFHASRGEMIALVGANGAGKTTTIQGLIGMLPTPGGRILIDGTDRGGEPFDTRHQYFGLLTQDYGRYELTVRDNLLIGAGGRTVDDATIAEALGRSQADRIVAKLPKGLDTQLGEQWQGAGLSGGEWQRIAMTRLFLRDAPIWILDEPTSNIDAETEERIFQDLREHSGEHITIVVSHRAWTLRNMDRIYVLDNGTITEHGTYNELNQPGTRFHKLFAFQNEGEPTTTDH